MTAEAFLDEAPLEAEAFLDEAQPTPAPTAESFLDAAVEDEPALPAATPSPLPAPNPELDAARDAGMREDQLIREEGIFPEGSQSWKVLDGRIYIDPARYNSAVENLWSAGVIDSDSYTQLQKGTVDQWDEATRTVIPSVEKATAARRDLERRAGAFPEAKATASGLLKGAMQTGAAIVGGGAAATATGFTGPGAIAVGIGAGTAAALGTGAAYDKLLELSSKESDLLDSFYAANQLKPGYNTGGQLVSILAPTPVSISRLANAANLIQAEKGSAAAAKFVTGAFGAGAGIGVATDATIQVGNLGLDKLLHQDISKEVAMEHFRQTGEQLAPRPQYDPASTGISAIFGGLGAGLGVKARNKTYAPEELVTLESQVKTGRATRQEAEDYRVMRQAVETLRSDERLIDAQAIRRATVDAAGFRFLDTTEIINPRFQQSALADAGFTPPAGQPALAYAAENPQAAVPLAGNPAAYSGQAFLNRGGAAPAFQGGSNALPGPEGIQALPGPAAVNPQVNPPVVSNDTFDPTTATLVDDIPPTASASVDQIPLQNYIFERRKAAALEFNVSDKELDENGFSEKELNDEYQNAFLKSVEAGAKPNAVALDSLPVEKVFYLQKFHRDQLPVGYQHPNQIAGMKSAGIRFTPKRGEVRPVPSTIPPTASAPAASAPTAPELTGSPEMIAGEGATTSPPAKPKRKFPRISYDPGPFPILAALQESPMRPSKSGKAGGENDFWNEIKRTGRHFAETHRSTGQPYDVRAQELYELGLLPDPSPDTLFNAYMSEVNSYRQIKDGDPTEAEQDKIQKQYNAFAKQALDPSKTKKSKLQPVTTSDLNIGDRVKIADEWLNVKAIDPETFTISLEDGAKFGLQKVEDGTQMWVQETEISPASEDDAVSFLNETDITPAAARQADPFSGNLFAPDEMPFSLDRPLEDDSLKLQREADEAKRQQAAYDEAQKGQTNMAFADAGPPAKSSRGGKTMADAGPPAPFLSTTATLPKPALETYNDAQVFADFPDAVGVVRSTKGSGWTMPLILGGTDKVPVMEMPELVEMVRSLTGNDPKLKRMPKALGTFNPGSGIITLRPDLFQNESSAMMTFAHEIGHLVSWMDERNIKLGNLGGHIMNVANYLKTTFPITPGAGPALTTADRRKLQAQAKAENPSDPDARTTRYRELVQQTMDTRNLGAVSEKQGGYSPNIREELINLSEWWKPFSYDDAKDSYVDYRHSAEELYADAISVLFNSPADLQARAPVFYKAFWNYADARPQVKASIFEIQNRILMGRDAVLDKRLARDLESFKAGAEVFVGKQAAAAERRASLTGWWENLKDQYWNRYQPLIESAAKARAAGTITKTEEDGIRWLTEEHPLADSKLQLKLADIGRLYQSLDAAGVPRDYFGVWLKHHRIANERYEVTETIKGMDLTVEKGRAVMANPGGETARTSAEMLASLQQRLGPEKTAALESAVAGFRDVVFTIMEDANDAGLFSADLWEIISANRDNYAAFTPLEYVQEYLPSAIRKQVGTFKEIADPLQQTVLKSISIHRAAQNNRFKRAAVEAIRQTAPELVKPAPMKYNGKAMVPQESQETGFTLVQWKEDGQLTGVHLPDRYARMWEDQSPAERDAILKLLSTGFQRLVYGAIIRYNPAFQLFMSPARDLQRSITNMPGGIQGRARFLQRLLDPETWGASVEWARGDIGKTELLREMIETAATGGPHSAFGGRMGSDDDSIDAILRKYHLQDQQSRNAFVRALMAPLKGIEFAGQVLQLLPKAAAYKVLVKDTGIPAPQAANTIRNHIGIPNYYKKGRHAAAAGSLVPFLNIFLRSYDSLQRNLRGAERNMGGKEWWLAWALTGGGLIAILQTLAKEGLFGKDLEKLYSRVPTWDMTNFAVLPLGEVPTGETGGKTVYARLPQDEGLRVINGVVSKMLTSAIRSAKGDPTAPQLGEVFAGISSQVPGTNTIVELAQNWTTFLAGRNPRDDFRNRYILSDDQWLAGGWEATKPMLGWTLEQTGITNFFTYDPKADTLTETTLSAAPILNRFIKISDRGVYQSEAKADEADKRDMAKVRLSLPDQVNGLRTEYNYLKNRGENRSDRETLRYYELGQWYRTYRQAMDEVETNMEFGNRAAAQSAIRGLTQDSKLYKAR